MKRRSISAPRVFGCPPILWFDDPEKLQHYLGRSTYSLLRMADEGLRIHERLSADGSRRRYVIVEEFFAHLAATENRFASQGEQEVAS